MDKLIKRRVIIVSILSMIMSFGFSSWSAMFNNYSVEILNLNSSEIGFIQSVREIPGLLGFIVVYLLIFIPESKLIGLMVALSGIGIFCTGLSGESSYIINLISTYTGLFSIQALNLTIFTLIMSLGFHYYEVSQSSLILHSVSRSESPKVLGLIGSYSAFGAALGLSIVMLVTKLGISMDLIYKIVGVVVIIGGVSGYLATRRSVDKPTRSGIKVKRKFVRYYILTFLSGSRRQIFVVFALYLLVEKHSIGVSTIALLMLTNQIITTYVKRKAGALIAKFGEQNVMKIDYLLLGFLFTGYAFIENTTILLSFYIIDGILFSFSIAITSYMHKISTEDELRSNVSLGMTINHIAAVIIPFAAGVVWMKYGHKPVFLSAVIISLMSLLTSLGVKKSTIKYEFKTT